MMRCTSRADFEAIVADKFRAHATAIHRRTDVMFAILMQLQWIGAIVAAGFVTPFIGIDQDASTRLHVAWPFLAAAHSQLSRRHSPYYVPAKSIPE